MAEENFPFTDDFQRKIAALLLFDREFQRDYLGVVEPEFFVDAQVGRLITLLKLYRENHGDQPDFTTLAEFAHSRIDDEEKSSQLVEFLTELGEVERTNVDYVKQRTSTFITGNAIRLAVTDTIDDLQEANYSGDIIHRFQTAVRAGEIDHSEGSTFMRDYKRILRAEADPFSKKVVSTGLEHLDEVLGGGLKGGELGILMGLPKGFKCHDENDQVMMFNGSTKYVRDVQVGDLLMGDDSTPRKVLQIGSGEGSMYQVSQSNGDTYNVTEDHILCLKRPEKAIPSWDRYHTGQFLEMSAKEYVEQAPGFHRTWQGYKVGVKFRRKKVPIDPYYIGLWLGDGLNRSTGICCADDDLEIREWLYEMAERWGMVIKEEYKKLPNKDKRVKYSVLHLNRVGTKGKNPLKDALRSLGLGTPVVKHVPESYMFNSRKVRLEVLAGLIDSDGHFLRVKGFVFNNANKGLCDSACWLARSVGLRAHVVKIKSFYRKEDGTRVDRRSYRTMIQGKVSIIPTKLARKKGLDSVKVTDRAKLRLKPLGNKPWRGFLVDKNHKYLMKDFTVTHNSGTLMNMAWGANSRFSNKKTAYITLELSEELQILRYGIRTAQMSKDELKIDPERYLEMLDKRRRIFLGPDSEFTVKFLPPYTCTPNTIRGYLDRRLENGEPFDAIYIDYLDLMGSDVNKQQDYLEKVIITTELRQIAIDYDVPIWTAVRTTREAVGKDRINMSHMSGAFERVAIADFVAALSFTDDEKRQKRMRIIPVASRNDGGDRVINCYWNPAHMMLRSIDSRELDDDDVESDRSSDSRGREARKSTGGSAKGSSPADKMKQMVTSATARMKEQLEAVANEG